jgi:uncharacterized protein
MAGVGLTFRVTNGTDSGLWLSPPAARAVLVIAHGAGAGMHHAFLEDTAAGLGGRGFASLRFQFPYMEAGRSRPDPPALAAAAVRGAVEEAGRLAPELPIFAGGKSFGGRMTSTAEAESHLPGVRGLFFLGFPLHPPGKPSDERAAHLAAVRVPMLFLQGTRDNFAELELLEPLVKRLGARATLQLFEGADHSFRSIRRAGRAGGETFAALLDALAGWAGGLLRTM